MRYLFLFSFAFCLFSCEKENLPDDSIQQIEVNYLQRSQRMAQVQNYFTRMIGNSTTSTLLAPQIYNANYNFNGGVNCISTTLLPAGSSTPNELQIDFDSTNMCVLPNGSTMHGTLYWDLGANETITESCFGRPGFLSFDTLYIDGCMIEEDRNGVNSPKYYYQRDCPGPTSITDEDLAIDFSIGSGFRYKITQENGAVTYIDPVASPSAFARLTTANDFDAELNILDFYERTYSLDILKTDNVNYFPYTEVYMYGTGSEANTVIDQFTMESTDALVYSPFECKNITSGVLELRSLYISSSNPDIHSAGFIQQTIDFGVGMNPEDMNECDNYVEICNYTYDGLDVATITCDTLNCLPL